MMVPKHIGFIMDGNRRWAKKRRLSASAGHKKGFDHIPDVLEICKDFGIQIVSLYCWSTENWARPQEEVDFIMNSMVTHFPRFAKELNEKGIRFIHSGRRKEIPASTLKALDDAVTLTKHNENGILNFLFNYGGRAEIVDSVRNLIKQNTSIEHISETSISDNLWSRELPDINLVIRTGGDQRISNFMVWKASNSFIHVIKTYWPDISAKDISRGIRYFNEQITR